MAESQSDDNDIQKVCRLEFRMRKSDAGISHLLSHPPKKIEPSQLTPIEAKPESEHKENMSDSIDLKTNQKLKEVSLFGEEKTNEPVKKIENPKKLGSESRRFVKRRLENDFEHRKNLGFDEKSDNSNECGNFHAPSVVNNNTKITDYFEVKLSKKPANDPSPRAPIDFKSAILRKEKLDKNPIFSMYAKKAMLSSSVTSNAVDATVKKPDGVKDNGESNVPDFVSENLRLKEDIRKLNKKILDKDNQINEGSTHFNELLQENKSLLDNVKYYEDYLAKYSNKTKEVLCKILLESEKIKKQELKNQLFSQRQRLGEYTSQRQGHKFVDVWVDGYDLRSIKEKLAKIKVEKEELEKRKKTVKSKKNNVATNNSNSSVILQPSKSLFPANISGHFSDSENNFDSNSFSELTPSEYKSRVAFQMTMLQREELQLSEDLKRLEQEKTAYILNCKRQYEEENCRFSKPDLDNSLPCWPLLNKKYQVLSLLGKGGFSEVYRVFDLNNYREAACKVHQLNPIWSEQNKSQYIKHAFRETQTHKTLNHPNIVKLYETFELDQNCLCTILEYCNGPDLSFYLKQNKCMQEKECKMIIKQILFGLKYLHENQRKIIHYDLKPQNILFHSGEIKITDFGLCKVIEDSSTTRLELTSQGVGTYWYLPPECFEIADPPPKISTKVDIWSVGVIFYEMYFGEKPFGNNMSQEKILKDQVILSSDGVKFPSKPSISNEGKELILGCLTKNPEKRWDVHQCLSSAYLSKK